MDAAQIATMIADRETGTPGPWWVDGPVWNQIVWTDNENRLCFMAHSNGLNDERDKANARRIARVPDMEATIIAQAAELERLRAALTEIATCLDGSPDYHTQGMGCGLEDRCITDRYEAMLYGWDEAIDRVYSEHVSGALEVALSALKGGTE